MKKHLSVFMLMARSSIYKIVLILLAMGALEAGLFYLSCEGLLFLSVPLYLEDAFETSLTGIVFTLGLFAVTFFLCRTGHETGAKTGYTLRRLSISEKQVFFWQGLYNTLAYLLFFFSQVLVVFALAAWYISMKGAETLGSQTFFLLFYRSAFIRGLWPMSDATGFVRNALLAVMLGFAAARYPMAQRQGSRFGEIFPACALTVALFNRALGESGATDFISFLSIAIVLSVTIWRAVKKEEVQDIYDEN